MARVGILGGSFDPVHKGHLRLAEAARAKLGLDRVVLVPAATQPLKRGQRAAPAEDRLAMLRLAAEGRPWLEVSDVELRRAGPSFTVDTLREIERGAAPGDELLFIAGADVLRDLDRWFRIDELLSLVRFVVATRAGYAMEVPERFRNRLRVVEIDSVPASATEVRAAIARGDERGAAELLPEAVARYVRERGLYGAA